MSKLRLFMVKSPSDLIVYKSNMKPSYLDWYADEMSQADWGEDTRKKWSPYFILALICGFVVLSLDKEVGL